MKKPERKIKAAPSMGISAKLSEESFNQFKAVMTYFKNKYGSSFIIADLLEVCGALPLDALEPAVDAYMAKKNRGHDIAERLANISDETRAKIEALLAEEVNGKA